MSKPWPMVAMGSILQLQRRWLKPEALADYVEIGVRCFGRGIFRKTPVSGASLGDKRVLRIEPGDLVFMNVFAWEGAVAVAGPTEAGTIGSHRFATYTPVDGSCDPRFLQLYFQTKPGRELLGRVSPGSAGRNRTMNIAAFAAQEIPLPPLAEQRRIVARIEELAGKIEEARNAHRDAAIALSAMVSSASHTTFDAANAAAVALGEVAEIRSGVTLGRQLNGRTVRLPYLRVANVQDGRLDLRQIKEVEVYEEEAKKWQLQRGDLLLTEGGDWDKLGRGTVWENEIPNCIHQNHIFRVRTQHDRIDPYFLAAVVGSPYGKAYFQSASKQTTNLASINQRQLKAFPVPNLPLEKQLRTVRFLDGVSAKAALIERLQAAMAAELDALLPSLLDRAFSGGLVRSDGDHLCRRHDVYVSK